MKLFFHGFYIFKMAFFFWYKYVVDGVSGVNLAYEVYLNYSYHNNIEYVNGSKQERKEIKNVFRKIIKDN